MGILLNTDVDWVAIKILEAVTKLDRVIISPLCSFQEGKQFLDLMKEVVVVFPIVVDSQVWLLLVVNPEHQIPKCRVHVKLLKHCQHIADSAQVSKASVVVYTSALKLQLAHGFQLIHAGTQRAYDQICKLIDEC